MPAAVAPSSSVTLIRPFVRDTAVARRPARTATPSAASVAATTADASGSSSGSTRSAPSTTVTALPNRANACASSRPIAPPPSTTTESGASFAAIASRLVQ